MNGLLDEAHLGKIRYGADHLERFNTDAFITTKQVQYAPERELRRGLSVKIISAVETGTST